MSKIHGCEYPDDLYYFVEKHVWAKPLEDGTVRVGMTSAGAKLSGGNLVALTVRKKKIGKEIPQGKSIGTLESSKFVGPLPAPVTGVLLRGNDKLADNPNLAINDPYGEGWIADLQPSNWEADKTTLVTGEAAVAAIKAKLESDGISCE
jgi:glycine cleavage system H protein